nr:Chain A, ANASTRAL SPINDLE 2 [Drosophila melanogaster]
GGSNKSDLAALVSLVESVRHEQQQLRNLCEMILEQQQRAKEFGENLYFQ